MQNTLTKTNTIARQANNTELKSILSELAFAQCSESPKKVLTELAEKAINKLIEDKDFDSKEGIHYLQKSIMAFGIDTHTPLIESVGSRYAPLALNFSRDLITEYDCKTPSEKATAQLVANAYVRVMEYSRRMEYGRSATGTTNEINGYYEVMSKELDRANRHYISALLTLKQLKAPSLQINIKTKNTFVAQNQQINSNQAKQ